ncbi:hypothetical protein MKY34_04595 [Sporosarcina sp. FSL K6-1522]|uniref:hypothetical protein n=1 Tax=Sporosarcina sp. FSL K6-1522 TaxID=2921554 RepID=UPI00315A5A47
MNLEEYRKLPDFLSVSELASLFRDVLNDFSFNKIDKNEFLQILSQLMDRQVMTYELLNADIRDNVDGVLCDLWNTESYDDVDIILSIVVNLGLKNCFQKIKDSISQRQVIDKVILQEIQETINEVGEDILNPYHGLEKFK